MRFTKYHSMNNILSYPKMEKYLKIFYSDFLLEMYPKEMYDEPIALLEQFGKTPWEEPFSVVTDQLMDAVNLILDIYENKNRRCISLWDEAEGDWSLEGEARGGKEGVFLLAPSKAEDTEKKPAVIICPGGGYEAVCFSGEGNPVLHRMEAEGYLGFILKYRVAPNRYPAPQEDLALAIRYVRKHADFYGVDENQLLVMGWSAGGHLCGSIGALHEEVGDMLDNELEKESPSMAEAYRGISARPDKISLSYPVISFEKEPHEGSFQALTGGEESLRKKLSVEQLVTEDYPVTYLWTCEDDDCVPPSNTVLMAKALEHQGVSYKMQTFPTGGHGCALAFGKSAYPWSREMLTFLK